MAKKLREKKECHCPPEVMTKLGPDLDYYEIYYCETCDAFRKPELEKKKAEELSHETLFG